MGNGVTGDVIIDASVNERHGASAQVTEHQVETGPNIVDHIRPMPRKLTIEGIITNTPIATQFGTRSLTQMRGITGRQGIVETVARQGANIGLPFSQFVPFEDVPVKFKALVFSGEFDRVRDVYGVLVNCALGIDFEDVPVGAALFTITTTLATYENFAIANLAVPRNAATGNALQFSIDFQEVRTVSTRDVAALPAQRAPTAPKKQPVKGGAKPPEPAPKQATDVATRLLGALGISF